MGKKTYELEKQLMRNAANEQVSHLNDSQLSDLLNIMTKHVPSLLSSPAAIGLFAHAAASEEFAWGSQRDVRFVDKKFRSEVLQFIAGSDRHTIYERPAVGEAYGRLFVHAKLAFVDYESYRRPIARESYRQLSDDASKILSDTGLTTREGRLNKVLYHFLKPAMPSLFEHFYDPKEYGSDANNLGRHILGEVMNNYKVVINDDMSR